MSDSLLTFIRARLVIIFVLLSYGLSWGTFVIDDIILNGEPESLDVFLDYFAKFGPTIAGLVLTFIVAGQAGLQKLLRGLVQWRVLPNRYLVAFLLPICIWIVALGIGWASGGPLLNLNFQIASLGTLALLFATRFFIGGGLGEEIGWRGVLLPTLQQKHGAFAASLIIGVFWGLWHAPLQFIEEDVNVAEAIINTALFTLYTTALSVIFTWHFNSTGGSILLCAILHATMNATNSYLEIIISNFDDIENAVILYGLTALAFAVLLIFIRGRQELCAKERVKNSPMDSSD